MKCGNEVKKKKQKTEQKYLSTNVDSVTMKVLFVYQS